MLSCSIYENLINTTFSKAVTSPIPLLQGGRSPMKYIYFGTSEFAATILEKLLDANMAPVAVVTQPDRPAGRGKKLQEPPVKKIAQNGAIPLLQPERIMNDELGIRNLKPDLFIVAAYGEIIPKSILDIPKHGCINVHPSLLPKYRGPSPIQTAIVNGDKETGVTLILLDEAVDHGPIIADCRLQIADFIIAPELEKELATMGAELMIKTIPEWIAGEITPVPQDHTKATFTKMITKEDGHIDWEQSAEEIERHVRAMTPWPGSWTIWEQKKKKMLLHLKRVSVKTSPNPLLQGEERSLGKVTELLGNAITVVCGQDMLAIHELQPEGKHIMSAQAFVNGHRSIIGSVLH